MVKIVINTNIFISALITPRSNSAKVLRLLEDGDFDAIVSRETLSEIERVLNYPKIKKRHKLKPSEIENLIADYAVTATKISAKKKLYIIKDDPSDNMFLECALAGQADFIVSGDEHLLELKIFRGIPILNPRDFLSKISKV